MKINGPTQKLILAFVLLLLGAVLVGVLSDNTNGVTSLTTQTETVNIAGARLAGGTINTTANFTLNTGANNWRNDYTKCIDQVIVFKNSSGATLVQNTDYVYSYNLNTNQLTLKNTAAVNNTVSNTTTATYDYCPAGYVTSSMGRTFLDTMLGLFALAVFIISVGLFYSFYKDVTE